jgi:hypothetical protein
MLDKEGMGHPATVDYLREQAPYSQYNAAAVKPYQKTAVAQTSLLSNEVTDFSLNDLRFNVKCRRNHGGDVHKFSCTLVVP